MTWARVLYKLMNNNKNNVFYRGTFPVKSNFAKHIAFTHSFLQKEIIRGMCYFYFLTVCSTSRTVSIRVSAVDSNNVWLCGSEKWFRHKGDIVYGFALTNVDISLKVKYITDFHVGETPLPLSPSLLQVYNIRSLSNYYYSATRTPPSEKRNSHKLPFVLQ